MHRGIRLFMAALCVLTWNMFDRGMMDSARWEIDVPKRGKDKQYGGGLLLEKFWIVSVCVRARHGDPSHVLKEPLIIKTKLLVLKQQYTLYYS